MEMICIPTDNVVLFYSTESLLAQVSEWVHARRQVCLSLCSSTLARTICDSLAGADVALFDATESPGRAMDALQRGLEMTDAGAMAVYTEVMHEGLELFVRVRGTLLLLGPQSLTEWDGFFQGMLEMIHRHGLPGRDLTKAKDPNLHVFPVKD